MDSVLEARSESPAELSRTPPKETRGIHEYINSLESYLHGLFLIRK
jgi:hypothetical protein